MVRNDENILLVNPGSPTFPDYKYKPGTVGFLQVYSGQVDVTMAQLKGKHGGSERL
jgi:predicted phosphodiesterase